jgi:putative membrane protein
MERVLALTICLALFASGAVAAAPDDAEVLAIVVAANQADMKAGELALSISKDPAVRRFAMRMITDHMAANRAASNLAARIGLKPRPSEASRQLDEAGRQSLDDLRKLTGPGFDAAYVAREVAFHQDVISSLDEVLIPSTRNLELASLLRWVRPNFDIHLGHARHLQASLASR